MANDSDSSTTKVFNDAILKGDIVMVKALLATADVKVDEPDEDGMTALFQACYRGNVEIAKLLVDSGANVNWSDHKQGYTALMFGALSGKLEIVDFLLSHGAKTDSVNCLKRTASEMASFIGNPFAAALINTYVDKSELVAFSCLNASPKLPNICIDPLHRLVTNLNFSPVKIFLYLSSPAGKPILQNWKLVSCVLEKLSASHFTPERTHEHISLKLHILSEVIKRAGESFASGDTRKSSLDGVSQEILLDPLIKTFLRGAEPHGLPKGQEAFLRKCLVSFPQAESTLWRQTVTQVAGLEVGESPTCLAVLETAINGLSQFARSANSRSSSEPCATCSDMLGYAPGVNLKWCSRCHEVAYCSVTCQKLHWFTHKKFCPILHEHHERLTNGGKAEPTEEEITRIKTEISAQLRG